MPNENENRKTEEAPHIVNEADEHVASQDQFTDTDEMYAVGKAYKRESETAAEMSKDDINQVKATDTDERDMEVNTTLGWIGIVLSFASFFFWPILLGVSGIVIGALAKRQNADTLGNIAIVVSVVSLAYFLIFDNLF